MKCICTFEVPDEDFKKFLCSPKHFAVGVNYMTNRGALGTAEPLDNFIKRVGKAMLDIGKENKK